MAWAHPTKRRLRNAKLSYIGKESWQLLANDRNDDYIVDCEFGTHSNLALLGPALRLWHLSHQKKNTTLLGHYAYECLLCNNVLQKGSHSTHRTLLPPCSRPVSLLHPPLEASCLVQENSNTSLYLHGLAVTGVYCAIT